MHYNCSAYAYYQEYIALLPLEIKCMFKVCYLYVQAGVHMYCIIFSFCLFMYGSSKVTGQLETVEMETGNGKWKWKTETVKT